MAPESTWGPEINVADNIELDLDALEEMIESIGEEVGERTEALAEELNERWGTDEEIRPRIDYLGADLLRSL